MLFSVEPLSTSSGLWIVTRETDQLNKNKQRLQNCFQIWTNNQSVAAALCPGWDDFLIWFDFGSKPARVVPINDETRRVFISEVMPLIRPHLLALSEQVPDLLEAQVGWAFEVTERVESGEITQVDQIRQPKFDLDNQPAAEAAAAVISALHTFADRFNAQYEKS